MATARASGKGQCDPEVAERLVSLGGCMVVLGGIGPNAVALYWVLARLSGEATPSWGLLWCVLGAGGVLMVLGCGVLVTVKRSGEGTFLWSPRVEEAWRLLARLVGVAIVTVALVVFAALC